MRGRGQAGQQRLHYQAKVTASLQAQVNQDSNGVSCKLVGRGQPGQQRRNGERRAACATGPKGMAPAGWLGRLAGPVASLLHDTSWCGWGSGVTSAASGCLPAVAPAVANLESILGRITRGAGAERCINWQVIGKDQPLFSVVADPHLPPISLSSLAAAK